MVDKQKLYTKFPSKSAISFIVGIIPLQFHFQSNSTFTSRYSVISSRLCNLEFHFILKKLTSLFFLQKKKALKQIEVIIEKQSQRRSILNQVKDVTQYDEETCCACHGHKTATTTTTTTTPKTSKYQYGICLRNIPL